MLHWGKKKIMPGERKVERKNTVVVTKKARKT